MQHLDTDIDLALDQPRTLTRPAGPRRRSPGDPSGTGVITVILAILVIAALFGGFLGSISGDLL